MATGFSIAAGIYCKRAETFAVDCVNNHSSSAVQKGHVRLAGYVGFGKIHRNTSRR